MTDQEYVQAAIERVEYVPIEGMREYARKVELAAMEAREQLTGALLLSQDLTEIG